MNSFKLKRYESFIELKDDLKEDTILISQALSDSNKFIKANNDLFEADSYTMVLVYNPR